jgi:DNA-binding transcriptional ArsR family regulator
MAPPAHLNRVLKAVGDPTRRRILDLLAGQDLPVGRIADRFKISRPAVIKHLRVLHHAKLVVVRPSGRERIQSLNAAPLQQMDAWLSRYEAFWETSLQKLKHQIESTP